MDWFGITAEMAEERHTSFLAHQTAAVFNSGERRADIGSILNIAETYQGDVMRHVQTTAAERLHGCEKECVVKRKDSVGWFGEVHQRVRDIDCRHRINGAVGNVIGTYGQPGLMKGLYIAVLALGNHPEATRAAQDGNTTATLTHKMERGAAGGLNAVGRHG